MVNQDTSIRISREEKQALDEARSLWERQIGRHITAGEFIRILADRYLQELSGDIKARKKPKSPNLMAVQEARLAQAQTVSPGPRVSLVTCVRCGGQIGWRTEQADGYCPYCGVYLRLLGK